MINWETLLFSPSPSTLLMWQCLAACMLISALIAWLGAQVAIQHLGNRKFAFFFFLFVMQVSVLEHYLSY